MSRPIDIHDERRPLPSIRTWVLVLAGAGFAAGFLGPIALNPEANQGPLVGIFITGPGGAMLGLVLGVAFQFLPVPNRRRTQALAATAAALVIGTLLYCLPAPERQGVLLEGRVRHCQSPADLAAAAIRDWEGRVAKAPHANVRPGWREEVPAMLRASTGVVLTIDVSRQNVVRRHRKPWNANRVDAEGWTATGETSQRYFAEFAGDSCADYGGDLPVLYLRHGRGSSVWPPDDLPNLLGLATVVPAPEGFPPGGR